MRIMIEKIKRILDRCMKEKEVDYKTAQKIVKQENGILLDVRSHQEYEEGHLEGSKNLCLYDLDKKILSTIPNKQENIIVYCATGARSKEAQELLFQLGYPNVYNLQGGLSNIE